MKRVQALVGGKKKQCTKLPTPTQKTKKSPTSPDAQDVSSPFATSSNQEEVSSTNVSAPATDTTTPTSPTTTSTTAVTTSPSTISSSSVKGASKIPAASPKKSSKDNEGTSFSKGRVRLDSEGKSKQQKKSELPFSRRSSKDKQKADQKNKTAAAAAVVAAAPEAPPTDQPGTGDKTGHDEQYPRRNLYIEESQRVQASSGQQVPQPVPQKSKGPPSRQGSIDQGMSQDPRMILPQNIDSRLEGDQQNVMSQQAQRPNTLPGYQVGYPTQYAQHVEAAAQLSNTQQTPVQVPLHGILKDTSSSHGGSVHSSNPMYSNGANEHLGTGASGQQPRETPHGRTSQPPSRSGSVTGSADLMQRPGYGSLPRSSRSTTPTPETAHSSSSLSRGSNSSTPTPQTMMAYTNPQGHTWGPLARRPDHRMGHPTGSLDRSYSNNLYGVISPSSSGSSNVYAMVNYSNRNYMVVNQNYQPPRPDSVPPPNLDSPDSLPRPGSVPPIYYSDTEAGGVYHRGMRAGSVPLGYESESSVYGIPAPRTSGHPHAARNYESDSGYPQRSGLRVSPGDEQYRVVPGRRPVPRRHTVGAPHNRQAVKNVETERKREAFMQLLAQRYPQYADKIQGSGTSPTPTPTQQLEQPARSRDAQRRRTAVVTYDPNQAAQTLEYDDLGTMSDLELPSFQRGGFMRTSLPIVRSASTSLERPLGLVFLVYGDQTKKSLLPNEITTLDTVRALFVRAFPDLTMDMLESTRRKIYILDPATNIYFQLEDLAEIKDRSVLKIHETDSIEPQKVKERQEVRGRTVQMPASRPHPRPAFQDGHPEFIKAQSLPPQAAHNYQELMQDQRNQWEIERRSRSRTPEPVERPRSLSAGAASRQRYAHSPDRMPTPERGPLNPIPENRQLTPRHVDHGNYYEPIAPYRNQYYDAPVAYPGYPSSSPIPAQQTYVARSTRAPPMAHPQRAVAPSADIRDRGNNPNRHSLAFAPMSIAQPPEGGYQRSQSYRIPPSERGGTDLSRSHSVTPADPFTRNRIEKMEQQLANLTAWVHYQKSDGTRREVTSPPRSVGSTTSDSSETFPASSASKHNGETAPLSTNHLVKTQGVSDAPDSHNSYQQRSSGLSSRESTPLSAQAELSARVAHLKSDLHVLRRQQQLNMEAMRDEFMATCAKIKKLLSSVPGAENQVNFHRRTESTIAKKTYVGDKEQVDKELSDLEASVEEVRADVISRQCRVNINDVEGMALLLSNITKSLADLKARFPDLQKQMKDTMDAEMRMVVAEEKFLKEEPGEIENSLKRCKKLTGTLYTLKRLASVQDHRPPQVPNMAMSTDTSLTDQKHALLENIRALVPDHELRAQHMEEADASRERKKKISTQQEALKFGKSLEIASKNLRPPSANGEKIQDVDVKHEEPAHDGELAAQNQMSQTRPTVPAKPLSVSSAATSTSSSAPISTTAATTSAFSVASVKPSFSAALTTAKSSDKPTATVSAMTAGVSESVTATAAKPVDKAPPAPVMRKTSPPTSEQTGGLGSPVHGGTGAVTHTVKVGPEVAPKSHPSMSTYQVCGPIRAPVFTKPSNLGGPSSNKTSTDSENSSDLHVEKSKSGSDDRGTAKPTDLPLQKEPGKKGTVTFSDPSPTVSVSSGDSISPSDGRADRERVDLATQKQAARSAFFSSMNTPPTSPILSPSSRISAHLDQGPVISPGSLGKMTPGPTINLVLSGTAAPMSPTSPGLFTISPPPELQSLPLDQTGDSSTSPYTSPARGIPRPVSESRSPGLDTSGTDVDVRQKKVPPPPPPRKGSRPTSTNSIPPVNGGVHSSSTQSQEMPRFVGGILGQHRLSGGPLSSTPKPISQHKPISRFEADIASGIYANMNRPDLQSQKSSPQQMISEASSPKRDSASSRDTHSNSYDDVPPLPPPPVGVTDPRQERGSSSESTSSSSGTSMGSQQSVVSVVRSASVVERSSSKSKPDPPKRQSSLLSKFTGSKEPRGKMNNGKAKMNGVDL